MSKKTGRNLRVERFVHEVLLYHKEHGRHTLPWRKTRDLYAILVSEIMLQQTQVDRVIPYFERWMRKFPTPKKLAQASLQTVLREWSGLGYNRRAKYLHEAAKIIFEKHGGKVPKEFAALIQLPGVGDYTAKAVRVFGYNEPEVLIETNVRAVFLHHFFPRSKNVPDTKILPLIAEALKGQESRTWYAALMDYGSYLKSQHPNPSRRSRHHVTQPKFEGSLRQERGKILRQLLMGKQPTFSQQSTRALKDLLRDGLIKKNNTRWIVI